MRSAPPGLVLGDALGPRGRRRVLVASLASALVVTALVAVALLRLRDRGQLEVRLWSRYTDPGVPRYLWEGLLNTLELALVAMVFAVVGGLVLALGRLSRARAVRWPTAAWIELFRGVPLLLLILFNLLALPKLGLDLSAFHAAALALVVYNSAVISEIVRAGVLSLSAGQREAALCLGLTEGQAMRTVILPQALRRMVPALVSQLVTLLKDTSLAYIVSYPELLRRFQIASQARDGDPSTNLQGYVLAGMVFVAINFALSRLARRLEIRQRKRYRTGGVTVDGAEDLAVLAVPGDVSPLRTDGERRPPRPPV